MDEQNYDDRAELILGSLTGKIEPVATSSTYRIAILLVAIVMVILPIIYIGIIALVGYGVYYHAVNHVDMLGAAKGRGSFVVLLLYLTPMVAGGFLFVFMLKPLFSGAGKKPVNRSLDDKSEPLLFEFVRRICDAVGAPYPKRIDIDNEVNASASFRSGMLSMLRGNDLILTIGLPLVAGLNTRQLGGVLAHEFGHFSQGAGMRLTYVIRTISYWLTRAVYERDQWDETLVSWSNSIDIRIGWVFYLTRAFVWFTRRVLWCLMWTGNAVSGYMLRQMEFDADRHETRLAGAAAFESTARRLAALNFANQQAQNDMEDFYREGRLPDDLPRLIVSNVDQFDSETIKKINEFVDSQTTSTFDTHPCDLDRIASAQRENTDGIFKLELPASQLFRSFESVSKQSTIEFFRSIFGDALKIDQLHSVDELLERQKEEIETFEALHRFAQGTFRPMRPIHIEHWNTDEREHDAIANELESHRRRIIELAPTYCKTYKSYDTAEDRLIWTEQASQLSRAGFRVQRNTFDVPLTNQMEINAHRSHTTNEMQELDQELEPLETAIRQRISTAITRLQSSKIADRDSLVAEAAHLVNVVNSITAQHSAIRSVRSEALAVQLLLSQIDGEETTEQCINSVRASLSRLRDKSMEVVRAFNDLPYPFDHAKKDITIAGFLVEKPPEPEEIGPILGAAEVLYNDLIRLQARVYGRLCAIAEQVELSLGLKPLEMPAEEEA